MVQNGSKWFEIVCSYCSFRLVLSSTAVYTQGLLTSEVKKAVNKMNCGCHMDPSHFFLSPQFIANWPDFRLNLNQLLNCSQRCSRFQVVIEQHWACALTCTDLHCIALRYCVFCHVLPCFANAFERGLTDTTGRASQSSCVMEECCRPDLQWSISVLSLTKVHKIYKMDWKVTENRLKMDKGWTNVGWCWTWLDDWIIGSTIHVSRWSR